MKTYIRLGRGGFIEKNLGRKLRWKKKKKKKDDETCMEAFRRRDTCMNDKEERGNCGEQEVMPVSILFYLLHLKNHIAFDLYVVTSQNSISVRCYLVRSNTQPDMTHLSGFRI